MLEHNKLEAESAPEYVVWDFSELRKFEVEVCGPIIVDRCEFIHEVTACLLDTLSNYIRREITNLILSPVHCSGSPRDNSRTSFRTGDNCP